MKLLCNLKFNYIAVLLTITLFSSSCQAASHSDENSVGEIQDIRVVATDPQKSTLRVEQFPLPNCGGSDRLAQSLGAYASVSKSATVGAKARGGGGVEVGIPETAKLKLEIQVELAYQETYESANSRLDTIEMAAAAGTHVVYTILWEEHTYNSFVQFSLAGKVYESPYTFKMSIPKIDKSYNVACPATLNSFSTQEPASGTPLESTPPTNELPINSADSPINEWECVQIAETNKKSTWETCWRYIQIDSLGEITGSVKENANAIEWIGPTDLSYTTIGQYHADHFSEWYTWALQKKPVHFCLDTDSVVQVSGRNENISAGCFTWERGPFMIELP